MVGKKLRATLKKRNGQLCGKKEKLSILPKIQTTKAD